ncbi:MAG: nucleotidyltransferase domain-containing protein, partial [Sulfobacillus sp.]
ARDLGVMSLDMGAFKAAWESQDFLFFADRFDRLVHRQPLGESEKGYAYQLSRFNRAYGHLPPLTCGRVYDLPALFSSTVPRTIYWPDGDPEDRYRDLLDDVHGHLADLLLMQSDLPGVNSLVRAGLVKVLYVSDGTQIVAKRDNPDKPGRFLTEQGNVEVIVSRLGLPKRGSFSPISQDLKIQVIHPWAVFADREARVFYSLSHYEKHPTLESILLREQPAEKRRQYLEKVRAVLDHLYMHGIVWGDMAPRNILVSDDTDGTTFHLLDFEKTVLTDGEVPLTLRLAHARGPMCVEEFGAVCALGEVTQCFAGYFDPESWPRDSADAIPYAKPKREVIDILAAQGHAKPALGDYNKAERAIMDVRFPFTGADGARRYPLRTSFKIDHYLGAEYDRKTTQAFLNAKEHGLLDRVVDTLDVRLQRLENRLILDQIISRLSERDNGFVAPAKHEPLLAALASAIDAIYDCGAKRNRHIVVLDRLDIETQIRMVHTECQLDSPTEHVEATRNWAIIEPRLREHVSRLNPTNAIVTLHGGGARGQFSVGSDLDIAVISADNDRNEADEIERNLVQFARDRMGLFVELSQPINLGTLEAFMRTHPDCFLDFFYGTVLCGPKLIADRYQDTVARVIRDTRYITSVRTHFSVTPQNTPKDLLRIVLVAKALGIECPSSLYCTLQAAKCAEAINGTDGLVSSGTDVPWVMGQITRLRQMRAPAPLQSPFVQG